MPFIAESPVLHVPRHTDDFRHAIEQANVDSLPDGIFIGKIFARETLIDHDHEWRIFRVLRGDEAAANQRRAHHLQILRLHRIPQREIHFAVRGGARLAFAPEGQLGITLHGNAAAKRRSRFHTGNRGKACGGIAQGAANFCGSGHSGGRQSQRERQYVALVEPGIYLAQRRQRADHQPGADQQHQRQRHFDHHKNILRPMARAAPSSSSFFQRSRHIRPRRAQRRSESENRAGKH